MSYRVILIYLEIQMFQGLHATQHDKQECMTYGISILTLPFSYVHRSDETHAK